MQHAPWRWGATAPDFGNRRGDAQCASCAACLDGLKLRFARRRMPAQGLRPPAGLGRLLRSTGKLGKGSPTENCLREVFPLMLQTSLGLSKAFQAAEGGFPICRGWPRVVRRGRRHMKLASMWRGTRRSRAKRAPAVFLLRRGSASVPCGGGGRYRAEFWKPAGDAHAHPARHVSTA